MGMKLKYKIDEIRYIMASKKRKKIVLAAQVTMNWLIMLSNRWTVNLNRCAFMQKRYFFQPITQFEKKSQNWIIAKFEQQSSSCLFLQLPSCNWLKRASGFHSRLSLFIITNQSYFILKKNDFENQLKRFKFNFKIERITSNSFVIQN